MGDAWPQSSVHRWAKAGWGDFTYVFATVAQNKLASTSFQKRIFFL